METTQESCNNHSSQDEMKATIRTDAKPIAAFVDRVRVTRAIEGCVYCLMLSIPAKIVRVATRSPSPAVRQIQPSIAGSASLLAIRESVCALRRGLRKWCSPALGIREVCHRGRQRSGSHSLGALSNPAQLPTHRAQFEPVLSRTFHRSTPGPPLFCAARAGRLIS